MVHKDTVTKTATLDKASAKPNGLAKPEAAPQVGDDAPTSSFAAPPPGEAAGAPSTGSAAPPAKTESGQYLEDVPGYDAEIASIAGRARRLRETSGGREAAAEADAKPLDAWFADLPARPDAGLLESVREVILGQDDRVQVAGTELYPWRCICALAITAGDGSRWIGTGFFVGPRTVVTAGHCVYIHSRGGWARSIELIPGADGGHAPFGKVASSDLRSVRGWTEKRLRNHDYGAIILPPSYHRGEEIGWFGYVSLSDAELAAVIGNLSGYPSDKARNTQWYHARELSAVDERTITYPIDTMGGQSGSPVWRLKDGERHVVGIHTNGDLAGNSATRICGPVLANIAAWVAEGS